MRAVVDTNVIAYFLLGTEPFRGECEAFWRKIEEPVAPAYWQAELTNVLWQASRHEVIDLPEALARLDLARGLGIRSVPLESLWRGALARAFVSGIAACDTLFVELAHRRSLPLATFDQAVLAAFPERASRPANL